MNLDHERYLSPFSWRYGSAAMRSIAARTSACSRACNASQPMPSR